MRYQCDQCQKLFHHPRKLVEVIEYETTSFQAHEIKTAKTPKVTCETSVCPHCNNVGFAEYVEPQETINNVKSVSLEDCDQWLAQGYKVKELYAKTATMIKTGEA